MSQHFFVSKQGQMLVAGYDRLLKDFFFTLFDRESHYPDKPSETCLDGAVDTTSLESIRARVDLLVPNVPENFWACILDDQTHNVGNRVVHYNADGSIAHDARAEPACA